jgi:uncharacterized membrane protein YfhO
MQVNVIYAPAADCIYPDAAVSSGTTTNTNFQTNLQKMMKPFTSLVHFLVQVIIFPNSSEPFLCLPLSSDLGHSHYIDDRAPITFIMSIGLSESIGLASTGRI